MAGKSNKSLSAFLLDVWYLFRPINGNAELQVYTCELDRVIIYTCESAERGELFGSSLRKDEHKEIWAPVLMHHNYFFLSQQKTNFMLAHGNQKSLLWLCSVAVLSWCVSLILTSLHTGQLITHAGKNGSLLNKKSHIAQILRLNQLT